MKKLILVVAASKMELSCLNMIEEADVSDSINSTYKIKSLVSGVGTARTVWSLLDYLNSYTLPDFIINIGIAGSYKDDIKPGETVVVENDCFADSGIEETGGFVPLWKSGLAEPNEFPFTDGLLVTKPELMAYIPARIRRVKAITLSTASGTESTIGLIRERFNPDIETMEGAAVLFTAAKQGIPAFQLRSVSNM
ncbi:MAG: hypothetical protein QNK33_07325, partial [Bacteroidales bacterium]|nr:hypothetical protein [Bacteroidales bacterium]